MKRKKRFGTVVMTSGLLSFLFCMVSYADGNVSGAIEDTWKTAVIQIRAVVDHVVFPAIDLVLAVFFFGKLGTAYFDFENMANLNGAVQRYCSHVWYLL